jgi:hypothetical protein
VEAFVRAYLSLVTSDDSMARVQVVLWAQAIAGAPELRASRIDWDRHFRAEVAELIARATGKAKVDKGCRTTSFILVGLLRCVAMQQLLDPASVRLPAAVGGVMAAVNGLLAA